MRVVLRTSRDYFINKTQTELVLNGSVSCAESPVIGQMTHRVETGSDSFVGLVFVNRLRDNASASGLNGFTGQQAPSLSSNFNFSDGDLGNVPAGFNNVVLDFGFTTGPAGTFNGGSVNDGLLPGESASFTVTGAAFQGFTEAQIANAGFLRFQNVPVAGSDVGVPTTTAVPEPTTSLLLGSGVFALVRRFRKGRARKATS